VPWYPGESYCDMWIGIEGFVNSCSEARRTGLVEARCPLVDSLERARVVCEEPYVAYGMVWFKCRHPVPEHFSTLHKGFHLGVIHLCSRAEGRLVLEECYSLSVCHDPTAC
jgi:hypothetical protein